MDEEVDYEALSPDDLQQVDPKSDTSRVDNDSTVEDEVRLDDTRNRRSYPRRILRNVPTRIKPIPRILPSQLHYPGIPAVNSETSELVSCVTRNAHELDIMLSQ